MGINDIFGWSLHWYDGVNENSLLSQWYNGNK